MARSACLALLTVALVATLSTSGPVPLKDREAVYDYKVTVGRENCDGDFENGFSLSTRVILRQRTDGAYNIQLNDLSVKDASNTDLSEDKYSRLKSRLTVPFEFEKNEVLTIFAPETTQCESVNFKRGLVNVLEVFDEDTKSWARLSTTGSSGQCKEVETMRAGAPGAPVDSSRFTRPSGNCSSRLPHAVVRTSGVASTGLYCGAVPEVKRVLATNIQSSGPGLPPTLSISTSERVHLESYLPHGLFDDVVAKSELKFVEIRDATSLDWTPTAGTPTSAEVDITGKKKVNQEELLKKAIEGFKMLGHCLKKLDADDHLEGHDLPDVIVGLTMQIRDLTKASLDTLYKSIDGPHKNVAFFQILGLTGTGEAFHAAKDVYLKAAVEGGTNPLGDLFASFFERIDYKTKSICAKTAREITAFWRTQAANDKTNPRLKNGMILAASAAIFENCIRNGKQDESCPTAEEILEGMAKTPDNEEMIILKIKSLSNVQLREGIPILKKYFEDKDTALVIRTQAAWALHKLAARYSDDVRPIVVDRFYDRSEDHELRISAFNSLARSHSPVELAAAVKYIVDNAEKGEDRQVVSYVVSAVKVSKDIRNPEGSKCPKFSDVAEDLWETIVKPVADKYGPRDILDSGVFHLASYGVKDSIMVSIIASKDDVMPRAIYGIARDGMISSSFAVSTISDGLVYNNAAQLKAMMDQMRQTLRSEKADVKKQLAAVLGAVNSRPVSTAFSLLFSGRVDGHELVYERFTRPEQILQRIMSKTVSSDRYLRNFKKTNSIYVKTHTESGLRVSFATLQGGISSTELPQFAIGQLGQGGLPISFQYNYKYVSRTLFGTIVGLAASQYKFVTGRVTDKAGAVYRNVSLTVGSGKSGTLSVTTIKVKSDPLEGADEKDIFYRRLAPFSGNVQDMRDYSKLLRSERSPPVTWLSNGHDYLGFGIDVSKSPDYNRPSIFKSPITRWCLGYQEIDDETHPYTFKVKMTKPASGLPSTSLQLNFVKGHKDNKYVGLGALTIDDPKDATKKVLRIVLGKAVDTNNPNKRYVNFAYENAAKNLYVRSHYTVEMPTTALAIPKVTKSPEWQEAYPTEKIIVNGKGQFTPSGREDFDLDAEVGELLNGLSGEADATSVGEFYRTEEQIELFSARQNTVEGDASQVGGDDVYSKLIAASYSHAQANFKAWDSLLKFHGMKVTMSVTKPPPDEVRLLWRKFQLALTLKHYRHLTFNVDTKAPKGTLSLSVNSTVDSKRSDLILMDKEGEQRYIGIKSRAILPLLRPSASPIKVFYSKALNLPTCTLSTSAERSEIETFDGRDIAADELLGGCSYLLAGNCRGKKSFAISYSRDTNAYTILYDDQQRIVVSETGFEVNGAAQPDKEGLVAKIGDTVLVQYKGLLKVKLPNKIVLIREKNSSTGYIQTSRIHRGRLCGLCGDFNGDCSNDAAKPEEFGTCSA